jgi:hypothetical protein
MLLGDADVEGALGMRLGELVDAGSRRHRRRDRHDPGIALGHRWRASRRNTF